MKGNTPLPYTVFLLPLLIAILLSSCEDCYQCGIVQPEPYFNVKFINEDALDSVEKKLAKLEDDREATNAAIAKNEQERLDSLNILDTLTDDPEREIILENSIYDFDSIIAGLREKTNEIRLSKTREEQVKKEILEGKIALTNIQSSLGNIDTINYYDKEPDSLTSYQLPLDMNSDTSRYIITIRGLAEDKDSVKVLEVHYRRQTVTENGSVLVEADSLEVIKNEIFNDDYKDDSVVNEFGPTNETTVYLYF